MDCPGFHHLARRLSRAARPGAPRSGRAGAACRGDADDRRARSDERRARWRRASNACRRSGRRRGHRAGAGRRARVRGDRAADRRAGGGGAAVPRPRDHCARVRCLRAASALYARTIRHPRALLFRRGPGARHPEVRILAGAVDAMLGGWDHEATLAAMRLASASKIGRAGPVRLSGPGADARRGPGGAARGWRPASACRAERRASRSGAGPRSSRKAGRSASGGGRGRYCWRRCSRRRRRRRSRAGRGGAGDVLARGKGGPAVEATALPDDRRNVVHVLSAHEARQWVLPVVFVCGMVEKQFPAVPPAGPVLPGRRARALERAPGIRVRTAAEFEREERALFDSAMTRATMLVPLSYPEFDARGERNLPSMFPGELIVPKQRVARRCGRVPRGTATPRARRSAASARRDCWSVCARRTARLSADRARDLFAVPVPVFRAADCCG